MNVYQKADLYDEIMSTVQDRVALEMHKYATGKPGDLAIQALRAEAYAAIVNLLARFGQLSRLPLSGIARY